MSVKKRKTPEILTHKVYTNKNKLESWFNSKKKILIYLFEFFNKKGASKYIIKKSRIVRINFWKKLRKIFNIKYLNR